MFDATSTTDDVLEGVDLKGKRFLVTGTSAGLGVETARALVAHGADVVGTVRDMKKGRKATQIVEKAAKTGGGCLELVTMDLASLNRVRQCADALLCDGRPFDAVINNAGIMATPYGKTEDGFETQFGTNHLGHFVLTNRIAELIRPGGRLVVLASSGHRFADINLDKPNLEPNAYDPFVAYGYAKTANILFAVEFDRRYRNRGIRATALHPGAIQTELGRYMSPETIQRIADMVETIAARERAKGNEPRVWKTLQQGTATTVWAAVIAPADEIGGRYCEDCHVAAVIDDPDELRHGVRSYALNPERAKALWDTSEKLVGERYE